MVGFGRGDLVSTVVRHRYNQLNRTITLIIDAGVWAQYGVRLEEGRRLAAGQAGRLLVVAEG